MQQKDLKLIKDQGEKNTRKESHQMQLNFCVYMYETARPGKTAKSYYVLSVSLGPMAHFTDWLLKSWAQFFFL